MASRRGGKCVDAHGFCRRTKGLERREVAPVSLQRRRRQIYPPDGVVVPVRQVDGVPVGRHGVDGESGSLPVGMVANGRSLQTVKIHPFDMNALLRLGLEVQRSLMDGQLFRLVRHGLSDVRDDVTVLPHHHGPAMLPPLRPKYVPIKQVANKTCFDYPGFLFLSCPLVKRIRLF